MRDGGMYEMVVAARVGIGVVAKADMAGCTLYMACVQHVEVTFLHQLAGDRIHITRHRSVRVNIMQITIRFVANYTETPTFSR
jgi:hypothetical protein